MTMCSIGPSCGGIQVQLAVVKREERCGKQQKANKEDRGERDEDAEVDVWSHEER